MTRARSTLIRSVLVCGLLVLGLAASAPASAQQDRAAALRVAARDDGAHVLEIRGGALWLNGRQLPPSAVPPGLDLDGLALSVEFSGPVTPVVEVDGTAYVLDGERLVRFDESVRAGSQVYFLGEAMPAAPAAELASATASGNDARLREAGEAAYLMELSESDRALYELIRREAELEEDAARLAEEIRRTADSGERARLRSRLRADLEEAFDLKQRIREAEIQRAEAQVDELRRMLRARAARRGMIIEHRLRQLIGE